MSAGGIYVHVPFCSVICPYCDFAVLTGAAPRRARFVQSLIAEIELWRGHQTPFDTIYFGGGTPSLLTAHDLGAIIDKLTDCLRIEPDCWLTMEANPEDVDTASARRWRDLGFNTVSLGVQSFDPDALRFLGRRHTSAQSRASVEIVRAAGFEVVSLDLMYALPDLRPTKIVPRRDDCGSGEANAEFADSTRARDQQARWQRELEQAVKLAPDHLSCYQLTVNEPTPFGRRRRRGQLVELDDDRQADLFLFTHEFLGNHGFTGYEVSSFASSAQSRSKHNQKYWRHLPYLGLGPSAHSFGDRRRWWNERRLSTYEAAVEAGRKPIEGEEDLDLQDLASEAVMLGLRTVAGVDLAQIERDYGHSVAHTKVEAIERLTGAGLITLTDQVIRPTTRGLAVADTLARELCAG